MKRCYTCGKHITEEEALEVIKKADKWFASFQDDDCIYVEALDQIHCEGPEEYFIDTVGVEVAVTCGECLEKAKQKAEAYYKESATPHEIPEETFDGHYDKPIKRPPNPFFY